MLKMWLKNKNITFDELNIDESLEAQKQALKLSGYSIVPLTVVTRLDGSINVIAGYNLKTLATHLV